LIARNREEIAMKDTFFWRRRAVLIALGLLRGNSLAEAQILGLYGR
jgi:hypothetical protein